MSKTGQCLLVALACGILVFCWQLLTVHYNYQDHWNALFCTGEQLPIPPQLASEHLYIFRGSYGYDGEYYHYIAHDPSVATTLDYAGLAGIVLAVALARQMAVRRRTGPMQVLGIVTSLR